MFTNVQLLLISIKENVHSYPIQLFTWILFIKHEIRNICTSHDNISIIKIRSKVTRTSGPIVEKKVWKAAYQCIQTIAYEVEIKSDLLKSITKTDYWYINLI